MKEVAISPRDFIRAGGRFSLAEWVDLSPDERAAAVTAGDEMRTETAEEVVIAILEGVKAAMGDLRLESLLRQAEEVVQ